MDSDNSSPFLFLTTTSTQLSRNPWLRRHRSIAEFLGQPDLPLVASSISPRVIFCGYSIPHPSDAKVNIRVQTTGEPARVALKDSSQDLMLMCQHVKGGFDKAVTEFKKSNSSRKQSSKDMDTD